MARLWYNTKRETLINMKTKVLTIIAVLFILNSGFANEISKSGINGDADLTASISKMINLSGCPLKDDANGEVIVKFMIDDMGYLKINNISTSNQNLSAFILKNLEGYRVKMIDENLVNKELTYRFSFVSAN